MAKSHCEKCGQNIEFDNSMIGKEVECPSCGSNVILETTQSSSEIEQAENDLLISQIPLRLKELINPAEEILYSSRPSKSSLILKVILIFLSSPLDLEALSLVMLGRRIIANLDQVMGYG